MLSNAVLAAWLIMIAALSLSERRSLKTRQVFLVRAFLPSWRFFDHLQQVPKVFYRTRVKGAEFGPWQPVLAPEPRTWRALFLNPIGNFQLAVQSLAERLAVEANESPGSEVLECSVSFQLMKNVVRDAALSAAVGPVDEFQFKISVLDTETRTWTGDLVVSATYALREGPCHDDR